MEALVRAPRVVIAIVHKYLRHCCASFRFVCAIIALKMNDVKKKLQASLPGHLFQGGEQGDFAVGIGEPALQIHDEGIAHGRIGG